MMQAGLGALALDQGVELGGEMLGKLQLAHARFGLATIMVG